MKYCLAINIGASSGRHIVGWREEGRLCPWLGRFNTSPME